MSLYSNTYRAEWIVKLIEEINDELDKVDWCNTSNLPEVIGAIRGKVITLRSLVNIQRVWVSDIEKKELKCE